MCLINDKSGNNRIINTTVGRVLFNEFVPEQVNFVNELLTKKALRNIIGDVLEKCGIAKTVHFLDAIKKIGFNMACPSEVALYGYEAMQKGKTVAIPGYINKFLASLHRFVSRGMATKIVRNLQEKNRKEQYRIPFFKNDSQY